MEIWSEGGGGEEERGEVGDKGQEVRFVLICRPLPLNPRARESSHHARLSTGQEQHVSGSFSSKDPISTR